MKTIVTEILWASLSNIRKPHILIFENNIIKEAYAKNTLFIKKVINSTEGACRHDERDTGKKSTYRKSDQKKNEKRKKKYDEENETIHVDAPDKGKTPGTPRRPHGAKTLSVHTNASPRDEANEAPSQ